MGGGGGKGGSSFNPSVPPPVENYAAFRAGQIGDYLNSLVTPARSKMQEGYEKFLNDPNYDISTLPGYSSAYQLMRGNTEDAYSTGRENILSTTPRGGAMYGALGGLESSRAKTLGTNAATLGKDFTNNMMNQIYQSSWVDAPRSAFTGLGIHAADTRALNNAQLNATMQAQQMKAQMEASENAGKSSGMGLKGAGIGSMLGLGLAPMTGGTSLIGSGMSALGGLGSGKGGGTTAFGGLGPEYSGFGSGFSGSVPF